MRKVFLIAVLFFLFLLLSNFVIAQGLEEYYSVNIVLPVKRCMCDEDCTANQGCLSAESGWILGLTSQEDEYIEEAVDLGYNGVCAQLYFQTHETPYSMTKDCEYQYEPEFVNLTQETTEEVAEEPVEEVQETVEQESSETPSEQKSSETLSEQASQQNLVTGNTVNENKNTQESETSENNNQNQIEEEDTMIPTMYIVPATIVIMGFFILIGWLAYLLYRK